MARFGYQLGTAPKVDKELKAGPNGRPILVPKGIDPSFDYNPGTAQRGFSPPDNAPPLANVRSFADEGRPRSKDVPAKDRKPAPERWPEVRSEADRERARQSYRSLFDAPVKDPLKLQTNFSDRTLEYLLKKEPARVSSLPAAKATIEDPYEIWMMPHRLPTGRVVMRLRYVSFYDGTSAKDQLTVVQRDENGNFALNSYPSRSIDGQREGYLVYRRPETPES